MSDKVDVYSYGVVLLELLTGKHPLDHSFAVGTTLVTWVESNIREARLSHEVLLDKRLLDTGDDHVAKELQLVMQIAVLCTKELPAERPSIRQVLSMLQQVRAR